MKQAIEQIKQLIQHHENERDTWISFFQSPKYLENCQEGTQEFVIEHTKKIYEDLIKELKQAIVLIEKSSTPLSPSGDMKLTCECGNEVELNKIDKETGEEHEDDDEKGQYVTIDSSLFNTWAEHDEAGIVCQKCNKAIWFFA